MSSTPYDVTHVEPSELGTRVSQGTRVWGGPEREEENPFQSKRARMSETLIRSESIQAPSRTRTIERDLGCTPEIIFELFMNAIDAATLINMRFV